jgi:hypothetical protein
LEFGKALSQAYIVLGFELEILQRIKILQHQLGARSIKSAVLKAQTSMSVQQGEQKIRRKSKPWLHPILANKEKMSDKP